MIGILGAYGNIGIWATRFIKVNSSQKLRIGGRNIDKVSPEIREEFANADWVKVDVSDKESIEQFITGCDCILDCTKISEKDALQMDDIASVANVPIVHLGIVGYRKGKSNAPIIYGAGSIPGLSGLIPQYLAQHFDSVEKCDFYYGGIGSFSYTAARDYMEGIFESTNHSMSYWKDGELQPFTPTPTSPTDVLESFLGAFKSFPYFDEESAAVVKKTGFKEARFQMCLGGERTLRTLDSARLQYKQNPEKTIEEICRSTQLDCFGKSENAIFVCNIDGTANGTECQKQLIISGLAPSQLTGSVAGATVITGLEKELPHQEFLLGETDLSNDIINKLSNIKSFSCVTKNVSDEIEGEI